MKFLFCVGAEKAGTTWLHSYFKDHPYYYDMGKELNLIQRDDLIPTHCLYPEYKSDIEKYFEAVSKLNVVTGDFTHYEGSTENIFRLFAKGLGRYDIEVVPVYIMRDPIKRAWSAWNMYGGGSNFNMGDPVSFVFTNFISCKYGETIQALNSVFSKPLYFFYEDFFRQKHVDRICDELNIPRHPVLEKVINKGRYNQDVPDEFVQKFCLTMKNKRAVDYVREVVGDVPWNVEDFKTVTTETRAERCIPYGGLFW